MAIQLATRSKALNVWTADELSYGRIAPSGAVPSDLDFKFQEGQGFVAVTRLAHYHNGFRFVLGEQLAGMAADTAAETSRAGAAEQKISGDLAVESKRAFDAEGALSQSLAAEVARANTAEGVIMTAVADEVVARQSAFTSVSTSLALEAAARSAADDSTSSRITSEVSRLDGADAALNARADTIWSGVTGLDTRLSLRIQGNEQLDAIHVSAFDSRITEITSQQLPTLSTSIANETARAQQIENNLQQQITSLLANTDATALNSLAELVADYSANGSGVNTALQAALARIDQLEQTVAALQASGDGGTPPVEN